MLYGSGGNAQEAISKECKRDLESEAKRLKSRIETFAALRSAIEGFAKGGYIHWLDDRDHITAFMVAFAGLTLELPALEKEYDFMLSEIEKDK